MKDHHFGITNEMFFKSNLLVDFSASNYETYLVLALSQTTQT